LKFKKSLVSVVSFRKLIKVASPAVIFAFYHLVAFQRVERTNLRIGLPVYRPARQSVDWYGFGPATLPRVAHSPASGSSTAMSRTYQSTDWPTSLRTGLPVGRLVGQSLGYCHKFHFAGVLYIIIENDVQDSSKIFRSERRPLRLIRNMS